MAPAPAPSVGMLLELGCWMEVFYKCKREIDEKEGSGSERRDKHSLLRKTNRGSTRRLLALSLRRVLRQFLRSMPSSCILSMQSHTQCHSHFAIHPSAHNPATRDKRTCTSRRAQRQLDDSYACDRAFLPSIWKQKKMRRG